MQLDSKVIYKLAREIARKIKKEHRFEEDPELYVVGLFLVSIQALPVDPLTRSHQIINDVFEGASYEDIQEEAAKLLHRKKVTSNT